MAQLVGSYIYTGHWINWSDGLVLGSTITLSDRDGGLLTAFLSMFVTIAGAASWRITSYVLHQSRCSQNSEDGLHHQQQITFRNDSTAGGAVWQMTQLMWYWRKDALRPFLRTFPFVLMALANMALFGLAGIFSSEVTKAADDGRLLRSPSCGLLSLNSSLIYGGSNRKELLTTYSALNLNDTLAASTYARACYGNTQNGLGCNQYVQQQIPYTVKQNASCPFSDDLCFYGESSAFAMDSGLLDSNDMLGINAPDAERVQTRKVTTCSPIHTKGYTNVVNVTDSSLIAFGDAIEQFSFGEIAGLQNYTYSYNEHSRVDDYGYLLTSLIAFAGGSNSWIPIPALNRTDADVSIFFLAANSVQYAAPVLDPFFSATNPISLLVSDPSTNITYYQATHYVNALACTDQYQYCNPTTHLCTPLTASYPLTLSLSTLSLNPAQSNTTARLNHAISSLSMEFSVHSRGAAALRASETVSGSDFAQIALPPDQWQLEVGGWFAVAMAKLQQQVVGYAAGPAHVPQGTILSGPGNAEEEKMCRGQIVRSPGGTISFSVLGLGVVLSVGAVLIFLGLVMDVVVGFARRRLNWGEYKAVQWQVDEKLQIQRLAYEGRGLGCWKGGNSAVPVTRRDDKFGMLVGVDGRHPSLRKGFGRHQEGEGYGKGSESIALESKALMGKTPEDEASVTG